MSEKANPLEVLFDFERRMEDGVIDFEVNDSSVTFKVKRKHQFEKNKELDPIVFSNFTESDIDALDLQLEEENIRLKRERLDAIQRLDAQIERNENLRETVTQPVKDFIKSEVDKAKTAKKTAENILGKKK